MLGQPKRILVFRALQLGDALCGVPALRALRAAHPTAEITLVGLPWACVLPQHLGRYIDRFEEFPGFAALPERRIDVRAWPEFLAKIQAGNFDVVIQMHGSGGVSNPICRLFGGVINAGYYDPEHVAAPEGVFLPYPEGEPEVRRHLALMNFLGCPPQGEELEFALRLEDDLALRRWPELARFDEEPFALIHPGARANERRWAPEHFAKVADHLAELGLRIVISGSGGESDVTRAVQDSMKAPVIDTAPLDLPLGQLATLLARASLLVCNDTGLSHLACALRVPSVVIFLVSDVKRWAPLDARRHRALTPAVGLSVSKVVAEGIGLLSTN